jgi:Spore Coat Protein U domain
MTVRRERSVARRGAARPWAARTLVRAVALGAAAAVLATETGPPAEALTATGTFVARVRVYGGCTLTTADLVVPIARNQTTPAVGVTTFTVACPGATFANPLPVRFTFVPQSATNEFIMSVGHSPKQIPYQLCNDAACADVYAAGVAGPVVGVNVPSYGYRLWAEAYPPPTGAQNGNYRQQVDVTLTY